MKWNKFRLKTTTEAEDIVSSMLADLGIEGVEIEDTGMSSATRMALGISSCNIFTVPL